MHVTIEVSFFWTSHIVLQRNPQITLLDETPLYKVNDDNFEKDSFAEWNNCMSDSFDSSLDGETYKEVLKTALFAPSRLKACENSQPSTSYVHAT